MQHERAGSVQVALYHYDTLGAPFKVLLKNGVTVSVDEKTGEQIVAVTDTIGLINAVVRARVSHPLKLNGAELKFIRKSIGVKAVSIAKMLDMSPEHYSRCEGGKQPMSNQSEKVLRMFSYVATLCPDPETELLGRDKISEEKCELPEDAMKKTAKFVARFLSMQIQPVFDAGEELCFEFCRGRQNMAETDAEDPNENWDFKDAA